MNSEIEQAIIITLLNHPNLITSVSLNADWFTNYDYRAVYEAVNSFSGAGTDLMGIYGKAKTDNDNFAITFRQLADLQNQYVTDANLQSDVQSLHKLALQHELDESIKEYQRAPFDDAQEQLYESISKLKMFGNEQDTGQLNKQYDELEERLTTVQPSGIKTYPLLDKLIGGGIYGSMLFTIGARPSVGKTAFAVNLAYEVMQQDPDVHIDFFTLEMNKREIVNRFISRETGMSSQTLRNPANKLSSIELSAVKAGIDKYRARKLFVYDQIPTLGGIVNTIRKNASRAKPNKYIAVIDYIGLVSVPGNKDRWIQVGQITRDLKVTANEFNVPIIALTQLNRGLENRQDKTPQLSDIRESGSVEQDSNVVAFLHRLKDKSEQPNSFSNGVKEQLLIQKNREGSLGAINFVFSGQRMLFKELQV